MMMHRLIKSIKLEYVRNCLLLEKRFASTLQCNQTALFELHKKYGGKIVNFGGFNLPVQYSDQSIVESHLYTREFGSIFDVSHMLQTLIFGKNAVEFMESITTANLKGIKNGKGTLTVFTNEEGNILDDLIATKINDSQLYVVSNAAMREQDIEIMENQARAFKKDGKDVRLEFLTPAEQSLLAVQGPNAVLALETLLPPTNILKTLPFMNSMVEDIAGVSNCRITRCGYTGEDGFEISIPSEKAEHITEALLNVEITKKKLKLAGLGARDSLRLEAGLCLYGSDIDARTSPVEASLTWLIGKRRREEKNFPGAENILTQLKNGVIRKRVGFEMSTFKNTPAARNGVKIFKDDVCVGVVTSGSPSPCLKKNIAMGYIDSSLSSPGQQIQFQIRNKFYDAVVRKMPFVPTKYFI